MPVTHDEWALVRRTVAHSVRSGLHCAMASRDPDGHPHVTPIGSVILTDIGKGFYFDIFNQGLARNLASDGRVTILAVDSGRLMWLRSLLKGTFVRPPGVRITADVGEPRPSTAAEISRFHRMVGPILRTRGGQLLWSHLPRVRDLTIHTVTPLSVGRMTSGASPNATIRPAKIATATSSSDHAQSRSSENRRGAVTPAPGARRAAGTSPPPR